MATDDIVLHLVPREDKHQAVFYLMYDGYSHYFDSLTDSEDLKSLYPDIYKKVMEIKADADNNDYDAYDILSRLLEVFRIAEVETEEGIMFPEETRI